MNYTMNSSKTIIMVKKINGTEPEEVAIIGNTRQIKALVIQCAELPTFCP